MKKLVIVFALLLAAGAARAEYCHDKFTTTDDCSDTCHYYDCYGTDWDQTTVTRGGTWCTDGSGDGYNEYWDGQIEIDYSSYNAWSGSCGGPPAY